MRIRPIAVCVVVVALAAVVARACGTDAASDSEPDAVPEPLADFARDPIAAVPEPDRAVTERKRTRVQPADATKGAEVVERPPPPLVDGEIPEELRGVGSAWVELLLIDAASEQVVTSRVRLWRLGVPADDLWPEGDQIHDDFRLAGKHRVSDLPPGRYRLEVAAGAPGSEDPPEFVVREGQENAFAARIELPAEVDMRLCVHDENGALLREGQRRMGGSGSSWDRPRDAPPWARPRTTRDPDATRFSGGRGGIRSLGSSLRYAPVEAVHGGFDLGAVRLSGKSFSWSRRYLFRFPDRSAVHVSADSRGAASGGTYVAVSVPPQPLIESIRLPDGERAIDSGAEIEVRCRALPAPAVVDGFWRSVPIRVVAEKPGYEKLEFEWCIDDGTPQPRTMQELSTVDR